MNHWKIAVAGAALAAGLGLSGCMDDGYGYGVSAGYDAAWDPYYGGFSADPYWGWYGDYYYPGVGIYVYDRGHNRHVWNDNQRRYWSGRRDQWQRHSGHSWNHANWSGYHRGGSDHHRNH